MRRGRQFWIRSGLALFAGCLLAPAALRAGVVGSPHDFSASLTTPLHPTRNTAIAPSGSCSACHIPHASRDVLLWPRNLQPYRSQLESGADPNYVLPPTIQCYDCHDRHTGPETAPSAEEPPALPNNYPAAYLFDGWHRPQNIAFGFTKNATGSMTEDDPVGSLSGYYENDPLYLSGSFGADPLLTPIAPPYPTDNTDLWKTGGHYFKYTDPDGVSSAFKIGDKLPCRDCHDPHAWDNNWQAFFRKEWPLAEMESYLGTTVAASTYMANAPLTGSRDTTGGGRKLCLVCHGTSNPATEGGRDPVRFENISSAYSSSTRIVRPKTGIAQHLDNSAAACVSCHPHNSVDQRCTDCHGSPPPGYPAGKNPEAGTLYAYPGGTAGLERTHARHVGHFSDNATQYSPYSFACTVCHADAGLHHDNNVDVVYDFSSLGKANPPSLDPKPFTGSAYDRADCANVYCHSAGHDNAAAAGYYRTVTWGTAPLKCFGCHGNPAYDNTNLRYGMPDNAADHANSHAAHVVNWAYECSVCHTDTAVGTNPQTRAIKGTTNAWHVNGAADVAFDTALLPGGTYTAADNTCGVACHGTGVPAPRTLPQWGGSISCAGCHQPKGALTGYGTGDAEHGRHAESYTFACEQCHARNSSIAGGNTTHIVGMPPGPAYDNNPSSGRYVEIRFTDNAASNWVYDNAIGVTLRSRNLFQDPLRDNAAVTPAYTDNAGVAGTDSYNALITWSAGTCGNVWCHSNGNPLGGNNVYRPQVWVISGAEESSGRCALCHRSREAYATMDNSALTDRMSRAHALHVANDRYYFSCEDCHSDTSVHNAAWDSLTPAALTTYHVNGSKEIRGAGSTFTFPATKRQRAYANPNLSYSASTRKCSNLYCHSDGSTWRTGGPFDNTSVVTIAWDNAAGTNCTSCHGGGKYSGRPITTGSHAAHVAVDGLPCSACHAWTVNPGTDNEISPTGYDTFHVNGNVEVVPGDNTSFVVGSCTNISCHAAAGPDNTTPTLLWGASVGSCLDCHGGTETWSYKPQADYGGYAGRANPVDNAQYVSAGHGRTTAYPSGNPGAGFSNAVNDNTAACYFCHSPAAAHGVKDPNDPFRLGATFAANTDALCLDCHGASPANPHAASDNTRDMQTHANGITGTKYASWPVTPWKCVDCHDPHGDGNYFMIRSALNAPTSSGDAQAGSDASGSPKRLSGLATMTFTNISPSTGYADNSYAVPGAGNWGICEVCHNQTPLYSRTQDNVGTHATRTGRCTTCHPHSAGFAAKACKGCHGPDGVAPTAPDISAYWTSSGHGKTGIALECEACHNAGYLTAAAHKTDGSVAGSPPNNINTEHWPGKSPLNADTNPNANTAHLDNVYFPSAAITSRYQFAQTFDNYCANACHSRQHRHQKDRGPTPRDVMRFGDPATDSTPNPKQYNWLTLTSYPAHFYRSQSPWVDNDLKSDIGVGSDAGTVYGVCVSCHDPHGTATTDTKGTGIENTNAMVRWNWKSDSGTFCGVACHTSRTPP